MRIRCRTCDICGEQMSKSDCQFWLRSPVIKWGVPLLGMKRMDVCNTCFSKMAVYTQHPELLKLGLEPKEG